MTGRTRIIVGFVLFGLLVADGAAWAYAFASGRTQHAQLLLYPERLDGQQLTLSLVKVGELGDGRYRVDASRQSFDIVGDPAGLAVGDEIYVGGRFESAETRIFEEWREVAPDRGNKKLLGVLGLLACGAVLPLTLGWRREGFVLRG